MQIVMKTERILDEGEECLFAGTVTLEMPLYHERSKMLLDNVNGLALADEVLDSKAQENESIEAKMKRASAMIEIQEKVAKKVYDMVTACDLKSAEKEELKTKDELFSHPDAAPIVEALMRKLMSNFAGNGKESSRGSQSSMGNGSRTEAR